VSTPTSGLPKFGGLRVPLGGQLSDLGYATGWRMVRAMPEFAARNMFDAGALYAARGGGPEQLRKNLGRVLGVPAGQVPGSLSDLESYLTASRSGLCCTPAAAESMAYLLDPPGLDEDIAEIWADIREGVVAALPSWAQDMYDYPAAPLTPARQTEIRQALGILDAVFLGEPGMLEARQRITLRMRAARQA